MLISLTSTGEVQATFVAMGILLPLFVLTGCAWPLEAQPTLLQHISYALPATLPIESLNCVIFRGWGISNFHVYKGFLSSAGYFLLFTVLNVIGLKFEKK